MSRSSNWGASRAASKALLTRSTRFSSPNWRAEIFTATRTGVYESDCQRFACMKDSDITQ